MERSGSGFKVAVVGCGYVGATFAFTALVKGTARRLALVDVNAKKARGDAADLAHGMPFGHPVEIEAGDDYSLVEGADVVVLSAGVSQRPGETRMDLLKRNGDVFREMVAKVTAHNRDCIFLVVTNPVDVLTYLTLKESGFPPARVIGSGTVLDTARFRSLLSEHCRVDARNVHAYILGEHGDSELPVWSAANIAGVPIAQRCVECGRGCGDETREEIFARVRRAAYEIIEAKGATYYAVALGMERIVEAIARDENSVLTVSSLVEDYHGVRDVCLSVPTVVNRSGVREQILLPLAPEERDALRKSAGVIRSAIDGLKL